jgi:tRNA threonylcarbamoyladenosine biosynthesis protein TsaE
MEAFVERKFVVGSARDLEDLAASIAPGLQGGDRVALYGELGAGKTVFVRGLARGLLHPEPREVVSPTFAIHNRYEGGRLPIDHLDLYRLPEPVRLEREGLDTVLADHGAVLCCEWSERLKEPLSGCVLEVRIAFLGEETRAVLLRAPPEEAARVLGPPGGTR